MHKLIAKYVSAYQAEQGDATAKVKKVLMRHSHTWEWTASEALVADLIDDATITAEDIVAFLADTYEIEGGSEEFHYAVCALQICLRKAELAQTVEAPVEEDFVMEDEFFMAENDLYMAKTQDILQTMQY